MNKVQDALANEKLNISGIIFADKIPVIKTFSPSQSSGRYKSGFVFMLKGKCRYEFESDSFDMDVGDIVYIPEGANYRCVHISEPKETRYYVLDFNISDCDGKPMNLSLFPMKFQGCDKYRLRSLFEKVPEVYNVYEFSNHLMLKSVLMEILYVVSKAENVLGISNPRYDDIKRALSYVEMHYKDNMSSEDLAKMYNMSHSHFRRLFVKAAGYPPTLYRNRIRVHKAYEMLINSNMSITQISEAVGFCDVYYFSTIFKKIIGVSPSMVRK